jgi:energy-coupling factor transporter ATP-binding protein EcfA2
MDIINVNDVCLTLGKTEILKHINVSFEEGKIHGLIGRNGSGKTMLMKCICGFIKPTSGANISGHGDVDIGHCTHDIGCDHNVDGGNPADFASMRMFTLQTIVAFFTVFSWSSIVLVSSGVYPALSTVIGFVLGLATMLLVAKIVQLSARLAENGTADYKNAIGETATVYIPCPPKDHGLGKVNVMINGQLREVTAINNGDELIKTGTQVRIIDLQGDTVVIEK